MTRSNPSPTRSAGASGAGENAKAFGIGLGWNQITADLSATVQRATITADSLTIAGSSQATFPAYTYLPPGAPMKKPAVTVNSWR